MRRDEHDELVAAVRAFDHDSFEGMGYRAERRELGTFWNGDLVRTPGFAPDRVPELLAEARARYEGRPVVIHVNGREANERLGPALVRAGCAAETDPNLYLAHTGDPPEGPVARGVSLEVVDRASLREACDVRLRAFANDEATPDPKALAADVELRGRELDGIGLGRLARLGAEPAAVLFCYDDPGRSFVFVFLLGTRLPFRRRGMAEHLLAERVRLARAAGRHTVLNVFASNAPALSIYRRLGFTDEVGWRLAYRYTP